MSDLTEFTEPLAVEAWDAWFRWREPGRLHDLTIDDTWRRVADALCADAPSASLCGERWRQEFAQWRLLPEEAVLRCAGTDQPLTLSSPPVAVVNPLACVRRNGRGQARLDLERLRDAGCLAVRVLDDLNLRFASEPGADLAIGLIGVASTLDHLGIDYTSDAAREQTTRWVAAWAEGCLRGSAILARERGARFAFDASAQARWRKLGLDESVLRELLSSGLRYRHVTALSAQPRLALLANRLSDALDPRPAAGSDIAQQAEAMLRLRTAVQPWLDVPIDYPLCLPEEPSVKLHDQCVRRCAELGLPTPSFSLPLVFPTH